MFLGFADVIMVGRFDTHELAYMSLATNLVSVAYITMMGMLLGTQIVAANLAAKADRDAPQVDLSDEAVNNAGE